MTDDHDLARLAAEDTMREYDRDRIDAERFRFIAMHLVQAFSLHMDGTAGYRLIGGWPMTRGKSFAEAIDNAMERVRTQGESGL